MRHGILGGSILSLGLLVMGACSSGDARAKAANDAGNGPESSGADPTARTAQNNQEHPDGARDGGWPEAQPHRFSPHAHPPHDAPRYVPPPAFSSLPPFVDGSRECFPQPVYHHHHPRPVPYGTRGSGGGGLSLGGGGYSTGQGFGSGHGRLGGSHKSRAPEVRPGQMTLNESSAADSAAPAGPARSQAAPAPAAAPPEARKSARTPNDAEAQRGRHEPQSDAYQPRRDADYGAAIYLSNDDTMSLSSAQRVIYAIDNSAPIPTEHVRPHELLNYFSFNTAPVERGNDFSVVANIDRNPDDPDVWSLGFAVQGRPATTQSRRNANLSFVLDRSGSMQAEGRMDYVKRGLLTSLNELKTGDIVNLTLFDDSTCSLAKNFVVGRDSMHHLTRLIGQIQPTGSTNLHAGLTQGYAAADAVYQPNYTNRVVMITDAETNTGITDESLIEVVGEHYDRRRIRLSGVGVGRTFNDSLLDRLTERGRGAYVFLGSDAEVNAVFGERFVSLIETVASDVHFRVHLPPSLALKTFYGEEASQDKSRVQAIHYFAGTSQMFLSDVQSKYGQLAAHDDLMFSVEYEDPESGQKRQEEFVFRLGSIAGASANLDKARLVSDFARSLQEITAQTEDSHGYGTRHVVSDSAYQSCQETSGHLQAHGARISGDPEVSRVQDLWRTYCGRYQASRPPQPQDPTYSHSHPPHAQPSYPGPGYTHPPAPSQPAPRNNDYAPQGWPSARR